MGLGDLYHGNTDSNGLPEGYVAGQGNPFEGLINGGWLSGWDAVIPGITGLWKAFDPTGSAAAQKQFENQQILNAEERAFNAGEAQKQRDFEERMSNSQYQRMVADLKAAGLNPYLALGNMGGAGTPSGSSASSSSGSADMANNKLTAAAGVLALIIRMILSKGK